MSETTRPVLVRTRRAYLAIGGGILLAGCVSTDRWASDSGGGDHGESGEIEIVIDGEPFDLTQDRFQAEYADEFALEFHLHEFDERWYMEGAEPVTVGEGIDLLPHITCEPANGAVRLTIDDVVYDGSSPDIEVETFVNDEPVEPFASVLQDGDEISVRVETG